MTVSPTASLAGLGRAEWRERVGLDQHLLGRGVRADHCDLLALWQREQVAVVPEQHQRLPGGLQRERCRLVRPDVILPRPCIRFFRVCWQHGSSLTCKAPNGEGSEVREQVF